MGGHTMDTVQCYKYLGFVLDGVLFEAHQQHAASHPALLMKLTVETFR